MLVKTWKQYPAVPAGKRCVCVACEDKLSMLRSAWKEASVCDASVTRRRSEKKKEEKQDDDDDDDDDDGGGGDDACEAGAFVIKRQT